MQINHPEFLVVDLFCGAGGTTTGFEMTNGKAKVIACVNHDHKAILSHWANYPDVKHYEEDIRLLDLSGLVQLCKEAREQYPNAKLILWASLECTNFSKAKGGLARDADSRTLAENLYMHYDSVKNEYYTGDSYIQLLNPDYVMIENVVEFREWGPSRIKMKEGKPVMIKNKHKEVVYGYEPIPELKGIDFNRWNNEICSFGYVSEWKELNSADFGSFTSRNRLFGIFAKEGLPIAWPTPTHDKKARNGLQKWMPVKEKLDFKDEGYSIFYRGKNEDVPKRQRKDLSENTLERVYAGCIKHIAGGKEAFMVKYHGGKPRTNDLDKPLTVIDTQNRHAFVSVYHGNGDDSHSVNSPAPTLCAADIHAAVFINRDFSKVTNSSVNAPCGTITAEPKLNLVKAEKFIDRPFSGGGQNSSIDAPVGAIMSVPKLNLVQADAFIDNSHYKNPSTSVESPANTITANRKYPYLISLQWGGQMQGVDRPSPTLLATAHKTPMYLIITETGPKIEIYETDSPIIVKLKEFMALYGIVDIKMRMLRTDELLRIQGFPDNYKLAGTQEDQKRFIGNSVEPNVPKHMTLALFNEFNEPIVKVA